MKLQRQAHRSSHTATIIIITHLEALCEILADLNSDSFPCLRVRP